MTFGGEGGDVEYIRVPRNFHELNEVRRRRIVADLMSRCIMIHSRLIVDPANVVLPISAQTVAGIVPGLLDRHADVGELPPERPPEGVDVASWNEHRRRSVGEWFGKIRSDAVSHARRMLGMPTDHSVAVDVRGIMHLASEIVSLSVELDRAAIAAHERENAK